MPCFLQVCFQSFCSVALFAGLLMLGPFGQCTIDAIKRAIDTIKTHSSSKETRVEEAPPNVQGKNQQDEDSSSQSTTMDSAPEETPLPGELLVQCYRQLVIMEKQLQMTKYNVLKGVQQANLETKERGNLDEETDQTGTDSLLATAHDWESLKQQAYEVQFR